MIIGLTGGLGCGKSEVARILKKKGLRVINADEIVHELLGTDEIKSKLKEAFGSEIFDDRGMVDRRKLAKIVFKDEDKLKRLCSIVHPIVREKVRLEVRRARESKENLVVEVPLLLESGGAYEMDVVVVVSAPLDLVFERLHRSRGWSREEIRDRMSKQLPLEEKERLADYVIYNDGSLEELEKKVDQLLRDLGLCPKEDPHSSDRG